jgi:hypothetical protein
MKRIATVLLMTLPLAAQDYKLAIVGMVHGNVWGHQQRGAEAEPFYSDYKKMLDELKPDFVWFSPKTIATSGSSKPAPRARSASSSKSRWPPRNRLQQETRADGGLPSRARDGRGSETFRAVTMRERFLEPAEILHGF